MDIFWHFWISKCGCFCPIFVYSKPKHPPSFISITWVTSWYSRLNLLPGLKAERITSRQGASDLRPRATLPSAPHARPLLIHPNLISCMLCSVPIIRTEQSPTLFGHTYTQACGREEVQWSVNVSLVCSLKFGLKRPPIRTKNCFG